MHWYVDVLKKYTVFSGRARRREFWMYNLFNMIVMLAMAGINLAGGTMIPYYVYIVATINPGLAVTARRLHDINRPAWFMLIGVVPILGAIVLLAFTCTEGDAIPNNFGPNPKPTPAHF